MFRYTCTILREYNVPGLIAIATDHLLLTSFHSLQNSPFFDVNYV